MTSKNDAGTSAAAECHLVWEGNSMAGVNSAVNQNQKNKWKVHEYRSEMEAKRVLGDRGYTYLW